MEGPLFLILLLVLILSGIYCTHKAINGVSTEEQNQQLELTKQLIELQHEVLKTQKQILEKLDRLK
ncbi:hypothetical protein H1D32_22820 [Anaerobacillus sp. CMMVII]|uniref:hypothetical protein n=1 Tax=Anaerobacillus sp. CMMVII TaxID=2755588 RepID=UPI0021B7CCA3|nr:hypothetical protein [Anaerobacillus sp. CMMVII]MCT8140280.1 hypothetical protein [Anaerobacillus sp. CMMVII]